MKRHICVLVFCFILTGCGSTPNDVIQQGARFEYHSKNPPLDVADCLANVIREESPNFRAEILGADKKNMYKILANAAIPDIGTVAVFIVDQDQGGSEISAFISQSVWFSGGKEVFSQSLVKSCL